MSLLLFFCLALVNLSLADVYMHACRGSNNRLDEANRDRQNGNRLYDSQNNNRGGYNVGKLAYYVGENVPISWSNQHSSGTYQLKGTELILQYMCDKKARDGTSTTRIPENNNNCENFDCDTDVEYGRHESYKYYQLCRGSSRNRGLFTANQNLRNRNAAINTRQNPAGTRRGYECPEERDYYPYWRYSPWKDIVIYTNQVNRCKAYMDESQNVKARSQCEYTDVYWKNILKMLVPNNRRGRLPLNETACNNGGQFIYNNQTHNMYKWVTYPSFGITAPECKQSVATRVNHLGLAGGKRYWTYNWVVPNDVTEDSSTCCVLRLRYNITTNDYPAWENDTSIGPGVDYRNNTNDTNPNANQDPAWIRIWENFQLSYDDIYQSFKFANNVNGEEQKLSRGYVFRNNPRVDPFGDIYNYTNGASRIQLQLAINTNQFGRTFQDRTHCFQIKPRPSNIPSNAEIHLLTVQGKRGNIVQVYPGTEYFFVPEPVYGKVNEYIHFCWTGSNTNPNNNDGQGKAGTDRSNICPLTQVQWDKSNYGEVEGNVAGRDAGSVGDLGNNYHDYIKVPSYGFPTYYNYNPKRDIPRKSRTATNGQTPGYVEEFGGDKYPYHDPYNSYYFREKGIRSDMSDLSQRVLNSLCTGRRLDKVYDSQYGLMDFGNMEELDDEGTTVCIEPQKLSSLGTWNYLCTRNNNFSNRSQKGTLIVSNSDTTTAEITAQGFVSSPSSKGEVRIIVPSQAVASGQTLNVQIRTWNTDESKSKTAEITGLDGGAFQTNALNPGATMELWIPYTPTSLSRPVAYRKSTATAEFAKHSDAKIETDGSTTFGVVQINDGGFYTIKNEPSFAYAGICILALAMAILLFFVLKSKCVIKK